MLDDPLLLLSLAAATVVAAAVHSALGFGSGPLLVPVLLFAFDPGVAVLSAVLVGMVVNVLQLSTEGRRPRVPVGRLLPLWLGALPGCMAGALLADAVSVTVMAAVVAAALILSATTLWFTPPTGLELPPSTMALAGAVTGTSAALTGIFGPLLGVTLVAAGERDNGLRDGLGASFLVVGTIAVTTSLALSTEWSALPVAAMLAPPAVGGYLLGRRGAGWLEPVRQRRAVLVAVLTGAVVALARAAG